MPMENGKESHSLTTGKPAKIRKSAPKQSATGQTPDNLSVYVKQVSQEVEQTDTDLRGAIQGYAHHKADSLTDAISELPTMFVDRLNENLGSLEVDRESFREFRSKLTDIFAVPGGKSKALPMDAQ